jgi:hypothetical protein
VNVTSVFETKKSLNNLSGIIVYVNVTSVSEMKSLNSLSGIIVNVNVTSIYNKELAWIFLVE